MTQQKTQRTPAGANIPIPTRGDFFDNLKKATTAEPKKRKKSKRRAKKK